MTRWLLLLALGAAVPLAPVARAQEVLAANPALATVPLTVTASGRPVHYTVEVARSPTEQGRGLMLRRTMPRDHGMIFPMDPPRTAAFWMEGTILPLDIIFIAPDRTILRIAANATPLSRADIPSGGVVTAVLELNAGEAARIGLKPGDKVAYALN